MMICMGDLRSRVSAFDSVALVHGVCKGLEGQWITIQG
jgi:hypothetical protein